ncbi:hypothetical protein D3C72_945120 [compost metagenome]
MLPAGAGCDVHAARRLGLQVVVLGGRAALQEIELARAPHLESRLFAGDEARLQLFDPRLAAEVSGVGQRHDAIAADPALEPIGAGAHGRSVPRPGGGIRALGDHVRRQDVGQKLQEGRIGLLEDHHGRQGVRRLNSLDALVARHRQSRELRVDQELPGGRDVFGGEGLAVVPCHVGAQAVGHAHAPAGHAHVPVRHARHAGREVGNPLAVVVQRNQSAVEERRHRARHVHGGQERVERIRLLGELYDGRTGVGLVAGAARGQRRGAQSQGQGGSEQEAGQGGHGSLISRVGGTRSPRARRPLLPGAPRRGRLPRGGRRGPARGRPKRRRRPAPRRSGSGPG